MAQTYRGDANPIARELGRAGLPGISAHDLLDDDHNRVLQLFNEYENVRFFATPVEKQRLAHAICRELKIHTTIEEEIYYPRVREKADIDDRVDAAHAEHDHVKDLIRKVEGGAPQDRSFDMAMHVLHEAIREHISEERGGMFDTAEVMGINTPELARQLFLRRQELTEELRSWSHA